MGFFQISPSGLRQGCSEQQIDDPKVCIIQLVVLQAHAQHSYACTTLHNWNWNKDAHAAWSCCWPGHAACCCGRRSLEGDTDYAYRLSLSLFVQLCFVVKFVAPCVNLHYPKSRMAMDPPTVYTHTHARMGLPS